MKMTTKAFPDQEALLAHAGERVAMTIKEGLTTQDKVSVIWSGGRTPPKLIPYLATVDVDWSRVRFVISDERWVALEHADSNEGELKRALKDTPLLRAEVIGLYADGETPEAAAEKAGAILTDALVPSAVISLLGMGADGHIASLFPGGDWGEAPNGQMAIAAREPGSGRARLSLTPEALKRTDETLLLCNSEGKEQALERARQGADPNELPVALLLASGASPLRVLRLPEVND